MTAKNTTLMSGLLAALALATLVTVSMAANPVFEVAVHSITATEGDGPLSLCVNVTAGSVTAGTNATVEVFFADVSTAAGDDYTTATFAGSSGNLTFVGDGGDDALQQCVELSIVDDNVVELDESLAFAILAVHYAGGSIGPFSETSVTIASDDTLEITPVFDYSSSSIQSYSEYSGAGMCVFINDVVLGDDLSVTVAFTFVPDTLTSDDLVLFEPLVIEINENTTESDLICVDNNVVVDRLFEMGFAAESASFTVSAEASDPNLPYTMPDNELNLYVYSYSSAFSAVLAEKGFVVDADFLESDEMEPKVLESDGEVEFCVYAPIREGHRGWQYPIPVTVTAEGDGLVEGVDFNFTDTVIEVPARVLDFPVPEGETDLGPPFCFNVTFYDNDLLTESYEYVVFNFDLDVHTIESSYSMDVEVYDDETIVVGFAPSPKATVAENDPSGELLCVELLSAGNSTTLASDLTVEVGFNPVTAALVTVNNSTSEPAFVTFAAGSSAGATACLDVRPIQDNVTFARDPELYFSIDDASEEALVTTRFGLLGYDDDDRGVATFNATVIRVAEDADEVTICYTLDSVGSDGISWATTLRLAVSEQTATRDRDFDFSGSSQAIPVTENATTIVARPPHCTTLPIYDDDVPEYDETFVIAADPGRFDGFAFPEGADVVTVIIEDDDRIDVELVSLEAAGDEGSTIEICAAITAGTLDFEVDLLFAPDFGGETADAADLTTGGDTMVATFAAGAGPGDQVCTTFVLVDSPTVYEGNETFGIVIQNAGVVQREIYAATAPVLRLSATNSRAAVTIIETTPVPPSTLAPTTTTTTTTAGPDQGLNVEGSSDDASGLFGLSKGGGGVLLAIIILAAIGLVVGIIAAVVLCGGKGGSKANKGDSSDGGESGGGVPMESVQDSMVQQSAPVADGDVSVSVSGGSGGGSDGNDGSGASGSNSSGNDGSDGSADPSDVNESDGSTNKSGTSTSAA